MMQDTTIQIPLGYKLTEVGVIPYDWEVETMKDVAKITMGQSPQSVFYNSKAVGLPLVQGNADVENRKTIIRNYTSFVTKKGNQGDILMSVRAPVGEIAKITFDCCLGRGVCSIKYKNDFLYHYLIFLESYRSKLSTGSTFDSINGKEVNGLKLCMPTLTEQTLIATALTDIDNLISELDMLIVKKQAIKQGTMQQLLTGKKRLPGFSGEWEERKLGDIFKFYAGKSKSNSIIKGGKYFVMDMGSVSSDGKKILQKLTNESSDMLLVGDLVMPKDDIGGGFIIGKTVYIEHGDKYVLGDHVFRLSNCIGDGLFFHYLINSTHINHEIKTKISGSAQLGLSKKTIENQIVRSPNSIKEQQAIAQFLSDMDVDIQNTITQRDKYKTLKQGMMQQLLTGKIRLKTTA